MKYTRVIILSLIIILSFSLIFVFLTQRQNDKTILIRIGHDQPVTNERHIALTYFKKMVEERSNGEIRVEIYPQGLLGNEAVLTESVSLNDLEMVATSSTSQFGSLISVFELPYLFDTYEEAWATLDGDIGREVADTYLDNNLRLLAYFENGFRQITSNHPINSPDDLKGLKIRTPEFPMSIHVFNALGANATPMGFSELYTALQQGTVDAQENPIANAYTNKFQEVQDYLVMTNHQYMPVHLLISNEFFQSLSKEHQEIIQIAAQKSAEYQRQLLRDNEQHMINDLVANGMKVVKVDKEPFKAKVGPVYNWFAKLHGQEIINRIRAKVEK